MDQEKIGKFIKEIRKKENLSQQKFAEKYGVTYQAVSKWENGKNIPDLSILKQMCMEYNMNLDDFLETRNIEKKNLTNRKGILVIGILLVVIILFSILIFNHKHENNFEFKTLSSSCENFNLYGSIAYNDNKSSIYISNVTYCGGEDNHLYKKIECVLYEQNNKTKTEISKYNYDKKKMITLEEFLKDINFKVDNYEKTCKVYKENSLHLEIEATDKNNKVTTYKIPLKLKDNCER